MFFIRHHHHLHVLGVYCIDSHTSFSSTTSVLYTLSFVSFTISLDHVKSFFSNPLIPTLSPQPSTDSITFFLTLCFLMELIIRLLGYGIVKYFSDNFNTFDFFIVFVSMIDLALTPLPTLISGSEEEEGRGGSLSALRSFRLLRLLRLFRSHSLKLLLYKVAGVIVSMYSFVMLLFLYVFIMSLIGMQFFANRFRFEEDGNPALPITSDAWVNAPDR